MGSSKQEKMIKKIKKRIREPVEYSESARVIHSDDTRPVSIMNEGDVAEADKKTHKSKKARKNRSKEKSSVSAPSIVANGADDSVDDDKKTLKKKIKPSKKVQEDAMSDVRKSKKSLKNKSKNNPSCVPSITVNDADKSFKEKRKSKKVHKEKNVTSPNKKTKSEQEVQEVKIPDVYQISSEGEDDSKGMKKWIKEYHERRPGIKILQDRIDEFITAREEQEEQQRKEREAKLSEEGWTVVHRKGGKRTTDPESGIAVGSVAEVAVREKIANKKTKDIGLDFYRFQRKEAHRSEVMKLQSKFEEDKKRIQQIRAARKFKPY